MRYRREYRDEQYGDGNARGFARSGWVTAIVIAVLLLGFGIGWHLHQRAKFHQFTAPVIPQTTSAPMPGGQEAILLSRVALLNDSEPEFVSATVLPGIGMQLLQAAVAAPNESQQNLLSSAPLSDVARMPADQVVSAPLHVRVGMRHLQDQNSGDDLVGFAPATNPKNQTLIDGGQATGSFRSAGDHAGVTATVEITLAGREIDLVVRAVNTTAENRYISFEWAPRFSTTTTASNQLRLSVPSHMVLQEGRSHSVDGTPIDFSMPEGAPVGTHDFDVQYVGLTRDFLGEGTAVRLQSGTSYFVRVQGMGDSLRSLRARFDAAANALSLGFSSLDLTTDPEQRDQTLHPGQTLVWHLRMEVLPVKTAATSVDEIH